MTDVHDAVHTVEKSPAFRSFIAKNKGYTLAHCFFTLDKGVRSSFHLGYYSASADRIVSFTLADPVVKGAEEEAFKESGTVPALDLASLKLSSQDALDAAEKVRQEKYRTQIVTKTIVLLQAIDGRPVWNLTFVTMAFTILNIRIDAETGELVSSNAEPLMNIGTRV